ncbi:MAG: hypothetical protein Q8M29_11055 [Bacteroidota bacterium]|nr:hypothetical protein [Bacteroidota bacterium]
MKGISYIMDEHNKKKAVVIDYNLFKKHSEQLDDMLDIIVAEVRSEEQSLPFEKVMAHLKKKGKL